MIEGILAVEGLDGVFIGHGDLTVALGAESPAVAAGKPVCVMIGSVAETEGFRALGASAFIVSTDQGLMRQAAAKVVKDFGDMPKAGAPRPAAAI